MKCIIISASLLIFFHNIFAAENQEMITLKTGQSYSLSVSEANDWGIKLSNDQYCMYKHISNIYTDDSLIVNQIKEFLPGVEVTKNSQSSFMIDFNSIIFETRKARDNMFSNRRSIQLLTGYLSTPNTEFRLTFEPKNTAHFLFEVSYSLNWYYKKQQDNTSFKPAFNLGAGIFKKFSFYEISVLLKYMSQVGDNVKMESLYVSPNIQAEISTNLFLVLSWNYYFNGIKIRESIENNILYLGIGYSIFN